MSWSDVAALVDGVVDAVESWIAGQSFWVQVPILLAVLIPAAYWVAGLVDRLVDRALWPSTRREARRAARHPAGQALAPVGAAAAGSEDGPR
ncbi:hypothetical protein [Nakamurella endophytica]|uniref:Uncharacterized protein n=1 Tax=Nakamurella endophytica TaxID=1748367 RepID=A0A917WA27_9ACTN|nr:hypothetical protein [Nakamurella endophytica]GGL84484.1 hypothetical protein GCM10011594_00160 [Nakamurella endophytica]